MKIFAPAILLLTLAACGQPESTSQLSRSPVARPTCTGQINSFGNPHYSGRYELYITDIFSDSATLVFRSQQTGQTHHYNMRCAHRAGWPSAAHCFEQSREAAKFDVLYDGGAQLSVTTERGANISLGQLRCS